MFVKISLTENDVVLTEDVLKLIDYLFRRFYEYIFHSQGLTGAIVKEHYLCLSSIKRRHTVDERYALVLLVLHSDVKRIFLLGLLLLGVQIIGVRDKALGRR